MLYPFFEWLNVFDFPGAGVFKYISFRAALAFLLSTGIAVILGKKIILFLQEKQIGETIRDFGLDGEQQKKGTPTMGGIIIILAILVPVLLLTRLGNIYIQLMILTTIMLGILGFIDDFIKVFRKNKKGLAGRFKIIGQVFVGAVVGLVLYFSPEAVARKKVQQINSKTNEIITYWDAVEGNVTTIPFVKNNELDYVFLIDWLGEKAKDWVWLVFVLISIFIVTAVSNGANMTDGLDGLATGTSAIIGITLAVMAYVSGHVALANYLNILYLPNTGELVVFIAAFVGACIGFLWHNAYPANVFMGDTGSLTLGGIIAVFALAIRKELLIPIFCGIFLIENASVLLQVMYFKYTKNKYGEGKRIFLMAPLHHHYQKKGWHEVKIVTRFWIVGVVLAIASIITLKLR